MKSIRSVEQKLSCVVDFLYGYTLLFLSQRYQTNVKDFLIKCLMFAEVLKFSQWCGTIDVGGIIGLNGNRVENVDVGAHAPPYSSPSLPVLFAQPTITHRRQNIGGEAHIPQPDVYVCVGVLAYQHATLTEGVDDQVNTQRTPTHYVNTHQC
jgi:hypothetical protein